MMKLQDRLNSETKPRREQSFHEDQPRRAALKCKERGFKLVVPAKQNKKNGDSNGKPSTSKSSSSKQQNKKSSSLKGNEEVSKFHCFLLPTCVVIYSC